MKSFTVDELIAELHNVAKSTRRGGSTKVRIDDIERNLYVYGPWSRLRLHMIKRRNA